MKEINYETRIIELLDFGEDLLISRDKIQFEEWLNNFLPKCRDDFMLAVPLYYWYLYNDGVVPTVDAPHDPWLRAFLSPTRGLLFWLDQWRHLLRVSGVPRQEVDMLINGYQRDHIEAWNRLENTCYPKTQQSIMELIREHGLEGNLQPFGKDYITGEWLYKNYTGPL